VGDCFSRPDLQVCVELEFTCFVLRSIRVVELSCFWQAFYGEFEPFGICEVHEVFSRS